MKRDGLKEKRNIKKIIKFGLHSNQIIQLAPLAVGKAVTWQQIKIKNTQ